MGNGPHRVSLVRCGAYDVDVILAAMRAALAHIRFDLAGVAGKTVLLKPNMLGAYPPHRHITTHPAFVEAAARLFSAAGARVLVGDSHNGVYPTDEVWNITGIRRAAEIAGAEIVPFEGAGSVERDGVRLSQALDLADIVVNLPKFKTHGLTVLTCAAKNLYGCVPGLVKSSYHRLNADRHAFAALVARTAALVNPPLTLIDAVTGMEGTGPSAGNPIEMGLLIAGNNVNVVDAVCCRLVGIDPLELPTLEHARQYGSFDPAAAIELSGEPVESCAPPAFELPSTYVKRRLDWPISRLVLKFIWNNVSVQPAIDASRCKQCGLCIKACPVDAIAWQGAEGASPAHINARTCIQCLCCHETCPYRAIDLNRSLAVRIGGWLGRRNAHRRPTKRGDRT